MESAAKYSKIDPELDAIFAKHGKPKPFLPSRDQMPLFRALSSASTARFMASPFVKRTLSGLPNADFRTEDRVIPVRDGKINVRIYRPSSEKKGDRPVLVMAHGGGWCLGGLDTEAFQCQLLCRSLELVVVDVEYRLCPEFRYPSPVLDVYDAVKWVSTNASTIGGDLRKGFLLAGVSGGGNLSTGATYLAREKKLHPPVTGSMLLCTGMPHESNINGQRINLYPGKCPSWNEHADAPVSSFATNQCYVDLANPDITSPLFTPLHLTDHSALPPLYYQAAGIDPWRDSAFLYTKLLGGAGVKTKLDFYPGVPHCWWAFYPQLSITGKWARDTVEGAAWLLEQVNSRQGQAAL